MENFSLNNPAKYIELKKQHVKNKFFNDIQNVMGYQYEAIKCFEIINLSPFGQTATIDLKILNPNSISPMQMNKWIKSISGKDLIMGKNDLYRFLMIINFEEMPK